MFEDRVASREESAYIIQRHRFGFSREFPVSIFLYNRNRFFNFHKIGRFDGLVGVEGLSGLYVLGFGEGRRGFEGLGAGFFGVGLDSLEEFREGGGGDRGVELAEEPFLGSVEVEEEDRFREGEVAREEPETGTCEVVAMD